MQQLPGTVPVYLFASDHRQLMHRPRPDWAIELVPKRSDGILRTLGDAKPWKNLAPANTALDSCLDLKRPARSRRL
jgi:hypothetical protein